MPLRALFICVLFYSVAYTSYTRRSLFELRLTWHMWEEFPYISQWLKYAPVPGSGTALKADGRTGGRQDDASSWSYEIPT